MIRLFLFGRRLPSLTRDEFQHGLLHAHAPLVRQCEGFMAQCNGYMQNHFGTQISNSAGRPLITEPRFDNCSEFWYESIDHILKSYNNDDYFRMLRPDENTRTDGNTRMALIAQETVTFEDPSYQRTPAQSKVLVLGREPAAMNDPAMEDAEGLTVQCVRKTENRVLGTMDFLRARISDDVVPEFDSITTYSIANRPQDGETATGGRQFSLFREARSDQAALWARSHKIFGSAA
ncbi:MAG: hypothetical protein JWQ76_4094 [Ramlibacter sp.]|nr:hypothetical protein [Ramlibacter sp.]